MGSSVLKSEKIRAVLAKNVRALLEQHQWSENELARRCGVSQKQVNNITMHRTGCGIDALDSIAHSFAIEPWQLLVPGTAKEDDMPQRTGRFLASYFKAAPKDRAAAEHLLEKK